MTLAVALEILHAANQAWPLILLVAAWWMRRAKVNADRAIRDRCASNLPEAFEQCHEPQVQHSYVHPPLVKPRVRFVVV